MKEDLVVSDRYYLSSRSHDTTRTYECKQFTVHLEMKSQSYSLDSDVSGHIVLECKESMPNRDFLVQIFGICVYYSENPFKQSIKTEDSSFGHEDTMLSIIHRNNLIQPNNATPTTVETFLEGRQLLRYAGGDETIPASETGSTLNITELVPGKYFLPFNLHLPNRLPPSIGLLNF